MTENTPEDEQVETEDTTNNLEEQDDVDLAVDQAPVLDVDDEPTQ